MAVTITNPLTITYNGSSKVLNRINQDNYGSEYFLSEATQSFRVKIRHSVESPLKDGTQFDRHNVEVTHVVFATADAPSITSQVYAVLRDTPLNTAATELEYLGGALTGLLTSDNLGALYGWVN
jgi:hypothetical protein